MGAGRCITTLVLRLALSTFLARTQSFADVNLSVGSSAYLTTQFGRSLAIAWVRCYRIAILPIILMGAHIAPAQAQSPYLVEREPGRHALVIGNANYHHLGMLPSAALDGVKIADRLRELGFKVSYVPDLPSVRYFEDEVLPAFRTPIEPGDLVVFYFSGHGFSYGPTNFIAPVDLPLKIDERDLSTRAIALENVETYLSARQPGLVLMVIDACRTIAGFVVSDRDNNEYVHKGVVQPRRPQQSVNTMIAFASRPGSLALASAAQDQLSIFTSRLTRYITREGYEFEQIMKDIGADVSVATNAQQQPGIEVWSYTNLYLRPTADILTQQKIAWAAALESKLHETIWLFSLRYSVSRYATAARKWLDDNPSDGPAPRYTLISPAAVERAWSRAESASATAQPPTGVAIAPPSTAFAFRRSLGGEARETVQELSDRELGLVASGVTRVVPTREKITRDVGAIVAHADVVTTRDLIARTQPSMKARMASRIPSGSPIIVRSAMDLGAKGQWLVASIAGVEKDLYIPVQPAIKPPAPVELGRAIREIVVHPRQSGIPDLVDPSPILATLTTLKNEGRTITWVSIATAPTMDPSEADARILRRFHVEYVLKQSGIEGRRITAVANADNFSGSGVRLRFFGF